MELTCGLQNIAYVAKSLFKLQRRVFLKARKKGEEALQFC